MLKVARGLVLGAVLGLVVVPVAEQASSPNVARAEGELSVGMRLMALSNVTLQKAEILKGSKVSVTQLVKHAGVLDGVALELADGHVVKVALSTVRSLFRVVDD